MERPSENSFIFSDGLSAVMMSDRFQGRINVFIKEDAMLEVYLVRHGKTVFNTIGRLQGWSDSPLTDEGRAAAAALGFRIGKREIAFDAAFSSTAPRAAETAGLILQQAGQGGLAVRQLPDLREYCFGGFEGEFTHVLYQKLAEQNGFPDAAAFRRPSAVRIGICWRKPSRKPILWLWRKTRNDLPPEPDGPLSKSPGKVRTAAAYWQCRTA